MSGDQKFNDIYMLIENLLNNLDIGALGSAFKRMINIPAKMYGRKFGWVDRIAFVASKADKVQPNDRDKLVPLLKDLARHSVNNSQLGGTGRAEFFPCISVYSSESADNHTLVGRPMWRNEGPSARRLDPEGQLQTVSVTPLPIEWPSQWTGAEYEYFDFYPIIPAAKSKCPKQSGIEDILAFILNE